MAESGLITFFEVTECGLHKLEKINTLNGKTKNKYNHVSGGLAETINEVAKWVADVGKDSFKNTLPWDADSNPNRERVYCADFFQDEKSGDALFVFCKALENGDDSLSGFVEDAKFGDKAGSVVKVDKQVKGKKLIYAKPMYYWFIPRLGLIASIKFSHSVAATDLITDYFKRCVDNFIPNECKRVTQHQQDVPNGKEITVKRVRYNDVNDNEMTYLFRACKKELNIKNVSLKYLADNITHLVVRDTISYKKQIEEDGMFSFFNKVKKKQPKLKRDQEVEIIEPTRLDENQLKGIMEVQVEEHITSGWNNVGFRLNDEDSTKWFNSYVARKHIKLDCVKVCDTYFQAIDVFNCLDAQREKLLVDFEETAKLA